MSLRIIIVSVSLVLLLSLLLHVVLHSPISPLPLDRPSSSFPPNNVLKGVEKLGEGSLILPEDTCVGKDGKLYTVTRDGWVKRTNSNGSWEDWKLIGGSSLLGLAPSSDGDIIVCDAAKGLLKVGEGGITVLATEVEGTKILFANDAIEASDGSIYFCDSSSKFQFQNWIYDLLEARPNGRLLKYDPLKKKTSVVLTNLYFPNGLALSPNEDYLIFSETWKFRCNKYWLKGQLKGTTEVFIENLPGGPDNINLASDGSFWIAPIELRSRWLDLINPSPLAKWVIAAFPKAVEQIKPKNNRAMVINVDSDGKIRKMLDDYDGVVISFVTSALEHEDHLYLGSLRNNFLGKLPHNNKKPLSHYAV